MNVKLILLAGALLGTVVGCRGSSENVGEHNEEDRQRREAGEIQSIVAEFDGATDFSTIRTDLHPTALVQEEFQKSPNAVYYCKLPRWDWDAHYDHTGQLWIMFDKFSVSNSVQVRLRCDRRAIGTLREAGTSSTDVLLLIFTVEKTFKPSLMIKGEPREDDLVEVFLDSGAPLIAVGGLVEIRKLSSD